MDKVSLTSFFEGTLLRPADCGDQKAWAFVVLPKKVSDTLPRRGRTSVEGTLNDYPFQARLEPDGHLSHWLKVTTEMMDAAATTGDSVAISLAPVKKEPEPDLPSDLSEALASDPQAMITWQKTSTLARVDWIHWIESAKQSTTRGKRVLNGCEMLASGNKRVCCFDSSGHYSKSFSAPKEYS
ncbi:YdeI/OmpD-associated family protein [Marinicella rhabdoformis]|uniref:YdeI/OmpD-associated family protein n=1 Tax=Marinicella rhabdoformis TaxID=2580566 RepID=UPI0012AEB5F8|nr:YdeI/OmpD-associated family protein [Marinicella rhabdoformis]